MKTKNQQVDMINQRKTILRSLLGGIVFSFALYVFAITSTTINIAEAKSNNREVATLQTDIAELEIEYFEMINELSLNDAASFGMFEEEDVYYAQVDSVRAVAYSTE